jgi:hypothetical protein
VLFPKAETTFVGLAQDVLTSTFARPHTMWGLAALSHDVTVLADLLLVANVEVHFFPGRFRFSYFADK